MINPDICPFFFFFYKNRRGGINVNYNIPKKLRERERERGGGEKERDNLPCCLISQNNSHPTGGELHFSSEQYKHLTSSPQYLLKLHWAVPQALVHDFNNSSPTHIFEPFETLAPSTIITCTLTAKAQSIRAYVFMFSEEVVNNLILVRNIYSTYGFS